MRSIKFIVVSFLSTMMLFSCDVIDGPYMETIQGGGGGEVTDSIFERVVLLEEFTAHKCTNCPNAALTASQLQAVYGERFIIIAYHSGYFAETSTAFPIDYTTPISDELYSYFGVESNPAGVLNRVNNGGYIVSSTDWGATTSLLMQTTPKAGVLIDVDYNSSNRSISIDARTKALEALSFPVWISVYITESGLFSPQSSTDGVIPNYEHKHVFRQSLNGTWGEEVAPGMSNGQIVSKTIEGTINGELDANNCEVVVFVYNKETDEVLTATIFDL